MATGDRGWRPEQRSAIELLAPVLCLRTSPDTEQALAVHEPHQDGQVHHERADTQDGHALDELVDLERQEPRRRDGGEVLGPSALAPQPDRLDAFDHGVRDRGEQQDEDGVLLQVEQAVEPAVDRALARALPGVRGEVPDEVVGLRAELSQVRLQQEQQDRERGEEHRVKGAVDGDEAQDDRVPQHPAATRQLHLLEGRQGLAPGGLGRCGGQPHVAARAPGHPPAVLEIHAEPGVLGAQPVHQRRGRDVTAARADERLGMPAEEVAADVALLAAH